MVLQLLHFFSGHPALLDWSGKSIAVVSNSGKLLSTGHGAAIDSADVTVRCNTARVRGYEEFVGHNEHVRIIAHSAIHTLVDKYGVIVIWGEKQHYARILPQVRAYQIKNPTTQIYRVSPETMRTCDHLFNDMTGLDRLASGAWLSTGWFATVLSLLAVADEASPATAPAFVTLYGFGPCAEDTPYHYWDSLNGEATRYMVQQENAPKGHRFYTEYALFQEMTGQFSVRLAD